MVELESSSSDTGIDVIMLVCRTLFVPLSGASGGTGSQFTSFLLSMIVAGIMFEPIVFMLAFDCMVGVLITIVALASLFMPTLMDELAAAAAASCASRCFCRCCRCATCVSLRTNKPLVHCFELCRARLRQRATLILCTING